MAANVTNTVALTFNTIGSVWGSLPELEGMGRWLRRVLPMAILGGAAGAALLLSLPAEGFEDVVPILLALSSLTIAIPQRRGADDEPGRWRSVLISVAIFAICLYGGYFGAAAGVMLLALFLHGGSESLAHANAAKNVVLGAANGVAGIGFIALAPVHWIAVWPLGLGCLIGARLRPIVVRHAPATPLRLAIAVAGLARLRFRLLTFLFLITFPIGLGYAWAGMLDPWSRVERRRDVVLLFLQRGVIYPHTIYRR